MPTLAPHPWHRPPGQVCVWYSAGEAVGVDVSGFLAAWFINPSRKQEAQDVGDYQLRVESLQTRIDGLDGKLEEILGLLRERGEG